MAPITVRVDRFAATMTAEQFESAVRDMGGDVAASGTDFTIINAIGPTPGHAMMAFVGRMGEETAAAPGHKLVWRFKPSVGTRRNNAIIEHVVNARFRLDPPEEPQP